MHEDEIINLMHRYLSGQCTSEEETMLENWLDENTDHRRLFNSIKDIWDVKPHQDVEVDFEEEWRRISWRLGIDLDDAPETNAKTVPAIENYSRNAKDSSIKQILRVAVVILLIAIPAIYFSDLGFNAEPSSSEIQSAMQKIETARGETASMEFSDGSKIRLNSMTTVRFPKVFNGSSREIYLDGEAFFRVKHDEDIPFIVHTGGVAVRVMGTEFNVDAYREDKYVEVVVKDGKVSVTQNTPKTADKIENKLVQNNAEGRSEVILTKGQRTLVKEGQFPAQPQNVSLKPYLAWVNGQMIFDGTPMRAVIPRLERAYNYNFGVEDSTLLSERLKASFDRETPEKVLEIITFSLGIDYEMRGDTVIFKAKK